MKPAQVKTVIIDTGASTISKGDPTDFLPGTMVKLKNPINMGRIAGKLSTTHVGIVKLEYLNKEGKVGSIKGTVFYLNGLKCRLYSPQTHFRDLRDKGMHGARMEVHWDYLEIHLPSQPSVRIEYDILTDLLILKCFNNA